MAIDIIDRKDIEKNEKIKAITYSHTGAGKTYFNLSGLKRAVLIDYEFGIGDVPLEDDIVVIKCYDAPDFRDAIEYIAENMDKFDTVVLDSLSKYGDKLFATCSEMYPDKVDSMNMWNLLDTVTRQRFEQLLGLNLNILIIALEEQVVLENGFRGSYPMYKAKKFKATLEAAVDIIVHLDKDEDGNLIRDWKGSNVHIGKNRYQKTLGDDAMKYNNFQEIIDKISKKND